MRFDRSALESRPFRMLRAAALALAVAAGPAAPAAAEPAFSWDAPLDMPPGAESYIPVQTVFSDSGTNPVFNSVTFSTTAYIDPSRSGFGSVTGGFDAGADRGELLAVAMLTNAELNALDPRPDSPFTFTADVTMTNDEGDTASATLTFETTYDRTSEPTVPPVFVQQGVVTTAPGATLTYNLGNLFDNAGANPRFTAVEVDAGSRNFVSAGLVSDSNGQTFEVTVKTNAELNALTPRPPPGFQFTVTATMTNDDGYTASGEIGFQTLYLAGLEETARAVGGGVVLPEPSFTADPDILRVSPGNQVFIGVSGYFDNPGAGAQITSAVFSTTEYYSTHGVSGGRVRAVVKTAAELNALATPPDSPFDVNVTVTMTNDAGQTATGTVTVRTTYERVEPEAPAADGPEVTQSGGDG